MYGLNLKESRILATRLVTLEEKKAFCGRLKEAVKNRKFIILQRKENIDFVLGLRTDFNEITKIIANTISEYDVRTTIKDNKDPEGKRELWVCRLKFPRSLFPNYYVRGKFIYAYLKVKEDGDSMIVVSFHECWEEIFVDSSMMSINPNNSFLLKMAGFWTNNYKKSQNTYNRYINFTVNEDPKDQRIIVQFEEPLNDQTITAFLKCMPSNMGIDKKYVWNHYEIGLPLKEDDSKTEEEKEKEEYENSKILVLNIETKSFLKKW
jgi:hypothetical protein